jgi:heterodisulfide reductase subunit A
LERPSHTGRGEERLERSTPRPHGGREQNRTYPSGQPGETSSALEPGEHSFAGAPAGSRQLAPGSAARAHRVREAATTEEIILETHEQALIIGGGIAGITAARDLASLGVSSTVVERSSFLGGHAVHFACKAAPTCQSCLACEVERTLSDVAVEPLVEVRTRTVVTGVRRHGGAFAVTLEHRPSRVDPARCTDCGKCLAVCPAADRGAVAHSDSMHVHPRFAIEPAACLRLNGEDPHCRACADACPTQAIDFGNGGVVTCETTAGAVVVATGFEPFDASKKAHLGYGTHPDIITALDLEKALRAHSVVTRPSNGEPLRRVAFVQCVGSRDKDRDYCSRVCCGYSLRMAEVLKERTPDVEISVFYIDLQPVGKSFEGFLEKCRADLKLVRSMAGDVYPAPSGRIRLSYQQPDTGRLEDEEHDLVVLAVGMAPGASNEQLAGIFGLELSHCGFIEGQSLLDSTLTGTPGVLLAGTVEGPRDIADTIAHAKRAAWHAAKKLGVGA